MLPAHTDIAPRPLLSVPEMAQYLSRRVEWVRQNAQDLGGIKVGGLWRFDLEQVQARLNRHLAADPLTPTALSWF